MWRFYNLHFLLCSHWAIVITLCTLLQLTQGPGTPFCFITFEMHFIWQHSFSFCLGPLFKERSHFFFLLDLYLLEEIMKKLKWQNSLNSCFKYAYLTNAMKFWLKCEKDRPRDISVWIGSENANNCRDAIWVCYILHSSTSME